MFKRIILMLTMLSFSEEIGMFTSYIPFDNDDSLTICVPQKVVALSGKIPISGNSTSSEGKERASLFFVIDNSQSMFLRPNGIDMSHNRLKFARNVIDTLVAYSSKYATIDCGLAVFGRDLVFDKSNDSLLKYISVDSSYMEANPLTRVPRGTYLPLVNLDQRYPSSGNMLGSEIIKKMLAPGNYGGLLATPPYNKSILYQTNISIGFAAATEALAQSKSLKENQFIIFISDGKGLDHDYLDGKIDEYTIGVAKPIATTFTIYFTEDGTVPSAIDTMTKYIAANGYSSSNSKYTKRIAFENTTVEMLTSFVTDSIISMLKVTEVTDASKISIGGSNSTIWDSLTSSFIFPHLLALEDDTTQFLIDLDVTITIDSIGLDSVVHTTIVDKTLNLITNVIIDPTLLEADAEGTIEWWNRELSVIRNATSVTSINELDKNLTVKFNYDPMTSKYSYSNVGIEIKSANSGDSLFVTCNSVGNNIFEADFSIDPLGTVSKNDNLVTLDSLDELIFTFRNSELYPLPLDTLQILIPYIRVSDVGLTEGALFDDNADGICDKIIIKFYGDTAILKMNKDEIVSHIKLPVSRGITVNSSLVSGDLLTLLITVSEGINTGPNNDDSAIVCFDSILSNSGVIRISSCKLIDSMAPVCVSATLKKTHIYDSLIVTFSESLDSVITQKPFVIISTNGYDFLPLLEDYGALSTSHVYSISNDASDSIVAGDSLYISIDALVSDPLNVIQTNPLNKRVPIIIEIYKVTINITEYVFYDPLGKGYPQEVKISFSELINSSILSSLDSIIVYYLENIEQRKLVVDSAQWDTASVVYYLTENGENYVTSVSKTDNFMQPDIIGLTEIFELGINDMPPLDSMAPVLIKAFCFDSVATDSIDYLSMNFSEPITNPGYFNGENPYLFKDDVNLFPIDLRLRAYNPKYISTIPTEENSSSFWNKIDSVRIHYDFGITDGATSQKAIENRMVELRHIKFAPPIDFKLDITIINEDNPISYIRITLVNNFSLNDASSIKGRVMILDAVGNTVITNEPLEYDRKNKTAILKWDGRNSNKRAVGGGDYIVLVTIDAMDVIDEDGRLLTSMSSDKVIKGYLAVRR